LGEITSEAGITAVNVGYIIGDLVDIDFDSFPSALGETVLEGDAIYFLAGEAAAIINGGVGVSTNTPNSVFLAIAEADDPGVGDWLIYLVQNLTLTETQMIYELGVCEENPSISVEVETLPTNIGDAVVKSEKLTFSFNDINVTADNYEWLRDYVHKNKICIAYTMYTDNIQKMELITSIEGMAMPVIEDVDKVTISGTISADNIDNVYLSL
jgi:hypothetical protein